MNRAWYLQHREVLNAWADKGAQIQIKSATHPNEWIDCEPSWAENREYRVKPETEVLYAVFVYNYSVDRWSPWTLHDTEEKAVAKVRDLSKMKAYRDVTYRKVEL